MSWTGEYSPWKDDGDINGHVREGTQERIRWWNIRRSENGTFCISIHVVSCLQVHYLSCTKPSNWWIVPFKVKLQCYTG